MELMNPTEKLKIILQPMTQRIEARDKDEDWTGKNSTAVRRKLQNRLNKRASRRRKNATLQTPQDQDPILTPATQEFHRVSSLPMPSTITFEMARRPHGHLPSICMHSSLRQRVTAASSFAQFLTHPLPVDQKLLTLLHFNLVRALTELVLILKLDPDRMNDDIESPFISGFEGEMEEGLGKGLDVDSLPVTMRPTVLQRTVSHHPEADMFPFPEYRDNMILAGKEVDDVELCMDVLYGIDPEESVNRGHGEATSGRTGLIVWDNPWLQSSWEVEEGFARKWIRLVGNCGALIESTNFWRRSRGERPLLLEGYV